MNTTASFLPEPSWSRRCSTETVFSIQGRETDFVQDSSDTDLDSEDEDLEYEPVTESEGEVPISGATSGQSDDELISKKVVTVSDDDGDDGATQRPDSESSLASDSEQEMPAYASCARCRHALENTRYRYCDKCFKLRKNFFPPRPRRKTKRESTSQEIPTVMTQDSGIESLHSQDLTSSQEIQSQDIFNQGTSGKDILSQGTSSQEILSQGNSSPEILSQGTSSQTILSQDIFSQAPSSQDIPSQGQSSQDIPSQGQSSQDIFDQVPSSQDSLSETTSQGHAETPKETATRLGKLKRRSESADRTYKRPRLDSESDCESNRKVNVAPLIKTISDPAVTIETIDTKSDSKDLCIICFNEPKSGVFVHRRVAHICCCYNCAVKVWSKARRCPVCNCKVSNVLKAVVM